MKTIAMDIAAAPAVAPDVGQGLRQLVASLRVTLARAAEEPQFSETERLVREAQQLRAAFLKGR